MLENLGEKEAANELENAVKKVLKEGKIPNFTLNSGVTTEQQTNYILDEIEKVA